MKTVTLYFDSLGRAFGWSANYPQGSIDLMKYSADIRRAKYKPYIHIGKCHESERIDSLLSEYTDLIRRQGYMSREQAEYGARVRKYR